MNFLINLGIFYIMIKFAMVFDNCMWMPADRKWYHTKQWKKHFKPLFLIGKREYFLIPKNKEGCKIIMSRIKEVLTHIYDIIPAIISATILSTIKLITGF